MSDQQAQPVSAGAKVKAYIDGEIARLEEMYQVEFEQIKEILHYHREGIDATVDHAATMDVTIQRMHDMMTFVLGVDEEAAEKWRRFVVMQAAGMGVTGSEVLRAKREMVEAEEDAR